MSKIIVKKAESNDWKILQKLNNEVYIHDSQFDSDLDLDRPFSKGGIEYLKRLADGKHGRCLIAYLKDKPVGYIAMSELKFNHRKSKYIEVENMGVLAEYRAMGIGKLLMNEAKKWANELDIKKLFVVAYSQNIRAINFYNKFGFKPIGLEMEMDI